MKKSAKENLEKMAFFAIKEYPEESSILFEKTFNFTLKTPFIVYDHEFILSER